MVGGFATGEANLSIGSFNSITNLIQKSECKDEQRKKALKDALEKIEALQLDNQTKQDLLDDYIKFSDEVLKESPDRNRVTRFFEHIKSYGEGIATFLKEYRKSFGPIGEWFT